MFRISAYLYGKNKLYNKIYKNNIYKYFSNNCQTLPKKLCSYFANIQHIILCSPPKPMLNNFYLSVVLYCSKWEVCCSRRLSRVLRVRVKIFPGRNGCKTGSFPKKVTQVWRWLHRRNTKYIFIKILTFL